jgi:predicted hotdog family 3-hydroxylacyl-ACP dehydratase
VCSIAGSSMTMTLNKIEAGLGVDALVRARALKIDGFLPYCCCLEAAAQTVKGT